MGCENLKEEIHLFVLAFRDSSFARYLCVSLSLFVSLSLTGSTREQATDKTIKGEQSAPSH
jgi:hypothetical protein